MPPPLSEALSAVRAAQPAWAAAGLDARLRVLRAARHRIPKLAGALADAVGERPGRSRAEIVASELIPLADSIAFLEREAPRLLAPLKLGRRGRPFWLSGVSSEIRREALGVILIIGPSNYPLFLPGAQAAQALAAGNAVIIKPGVGGHDAAAAFGDLLVKAGLDPNLCLVLDESIDSARACIAAGVDKVILTGSADAGAAVLADLAPKLTPSAMELSGCDAMFVLPGADPDLVYKALKWGLRFNGGATCIAPRRVFVHESLADELERQLVDAAERMPEYIVPARVMQRVLRLVSEAVAEGARALPAVPGERNEAFAPASPRPGSKLEVRTMAPDAVPMRPVIVSGARIGMSILSEDLFAPIISLIRFSNAEDIVTRAANCPYALGASFFGPPELARQLASRVKAGSVSINDLIRPTADPRAPFGGRGRSGFGLTRGADGLLEMTTIKVLFECSGTFRPHYDDPRPEDWAFFESYLRAAHSPTLGERLSAMKEFLGRMMRKK